MLIKPHRKTQGAKQPDTRVTTQTGDENKNPVSIDSQGVKTGEAQQKCGANQTQGAELADMHEKQKHLGLKKLDLC